MPHISLSSMGADIADINNDGNLDIFVTDMLPGDDVRLKTTSTFESYDLFEFKLKNDFWYQYMRNNLQLNNGNGTFSEIGQLAGVSATDWSWGALIFDMDNDGQKDLFVANGILKDLTDQDFVNFMGDRNTMQQMLEGKKFDYKEFVDKISSKPIPNYAYQNNGDLTFNNKTRDWGLAGPGFSNGSAYGDLDNDGDLDLVVNNLNAPLSVYKNKTTEQLKQNFLTINLSGEAQNKFGIGSTIKIYTKNGLQVLQQMPNRGFQSSTDQKLVFGLKDASLVDSLVIVWPDDRCQTIKNIKSNQTILLKQSEARLVLKANNELINSPLFAPLAANTLNYVHTESNFVDYNRDVMLKQKYSTEGPGMAIGDVNKDGLDDIYFGGAAGQEKVLMLQNKTGGFAVSPQPAFANDTPIEVVDALFFDADADQDMDLVVISGSNEFEIAAPQQIDVFYINDGNGNFSKDQRFPSLYENGSCVAAADFDGDKDLDLFIGSRMLSGQYGLNPPSHLFINDGTGGFKNQTKRYLPEVTKMGMVTDATWADLDGDKLLDLVVCQDWGSIQIYKNDNKRQLSFLKELEKSEGLWQSLAVEDIDGDGDADIVAGNLGENARIKVTEGNPAYLYTHDFDNNSSYEQIATCVSEDGKSYPMVQKPDLQRALPAIKTKFLKYVDYAGKSIDEIFTEEQLKNAVKKSASMLRTTVFLNDGKANFTEERLPKQVQFSNVKAILIQDFDKDGVKDLLMAGNFYDVLPEWGRQDASYGHFLKGAGKGKFKWQSPQKSGFYTQGQVRQMAFLRSQNEQKIVLAKNNEAAELFRIATKTK